MLVRDSLPTGYPALPMDDERVYHDSELLLGSIYVIPFAPFNTTSVPARARNEANFCGIASHRLGGIPHRFASPRGKISNDASPRIAS